MELLRIQLDAAALDAADTDAHLLSHAFGCVVPGAQPRRLALSAMPQARQIELLLPAAVVRVVRLKLPRASGMALRRVLPNLIEDRVADDVAACHVAVLPGIAADGQRDVAIVGRDWMKLAQRVIALRRPRRAVVLSEAFLCAELPALSVEGAQGFVRHAGGVLPFGVSGGQVPAELRLLAGALKGQRVMTSGLDAPTCAAWSAALECECVPTPAPWTSVPAIDPAWSLLQFEYARTSGDGHAGWRPWRLSMALGAACAVAAIGGINLDAWRLARERDALQARMEADYRAAFPGGGPLVDPLAQARRQVAGASSGGGEPYLMLTTALARALDGVPLRPGAGALRALDYQAGQISVQLAPGIDGAALADRLRQSGLDARAGSASADGSTVLQLRKPS